MTTKRTLRRQNADLKTRAETLASQLDETSKARDGWKRAAITTMPTQSEALIERTRELQTARKTLHATEDQLGATRERLAQYGVRRTVSDVLEEHDIHRVALADALGPQLRHMNWDQLIEEARRTVKACTAWADDCRDLKKQVATAKRAHAALVDQIDELRRCNDDLSRQAVDRAGDLSKGAHQ